MNKPDKKPSPYSQAKAIGQSVSLLLKWLKPIKG